MDSSQKLVSSFRLPWHFKVGKHPHSDDMAPDGLGGAAPPEHLHGGFEPQTSSMNQGFNPLIFSHPVAQPDQWNPGNHFPPSNHSLNIFGLPKVFDPTAFSNAANVAGLAQQNHFSGATANNQSTSAGPPPEAVTTNPRRESVTESELQVTNLPPR